MKPLFIDNASWLRLCCRWVGSGILLLALMDLIALFTPPHFTDPVWELQLVGQLVERAPAPLLGLVLVFFAEATGRVKASLTVLSGLCILAGVLFLALVSLGTSATGRINSQNDQQVAAQYLQQVTQIQQRKNILNQATAKNLDEAFAVLNQRQSTGGAKNARDLKERMFSQLTQAEQTLRTQAQATRRGLKFELLKNALKWNLSAVIAGFVYLALGWFGFWRNRMAWNWSPSPFER
ncbi:HpsJ-like protein, cyanoexosortase A-associated [Anthocerotibacter panamensis]|uniref:HpsJ-like protein, cyanoexosortase A-associated n=1 Tax=Anthocerotibacter panamensis TaxID=2857077 RepID=UPI001C404705|nr:HpsJ family protein [Anthocerotibacter panamensis]